MPQNGHSLGRDITLVITTSDGPISFNGISGFSAKQDTTSIKVKSLDGTTTPLELPDAWSGTFDYDRQDGLIDRYFADQEQAYFDGATGNNISIVEIIQEPNNTLSEWRYTQCALKYDNAGDWKGDAKTTQRISFMAARRVRGQ